MFKLTFCFLGNDGPTETVREFVDREVAIGALREVIRDGAQYASLDCKRD